MDLHLSRVYNALLQYITCMLLIALESSSMVPYEVTILISVVVWKITMEENLARKKGFVCIHQACCNFFRLRTIQVVVLQYVEPN